MLITARLLVNGAEVPISGFQYAAPSGALGAILRVQLARPDITQVPIDAVCAFEIGIGKGGQFSFYNLLEGGRIAGRSFGISWIAGRVGRPGDFVEFNALSRFSNKWSLAPLKPITLYDPAKVARDTLTGDESGYIKDAATNTNIVPELRSVGSLSLRQVLDFAYREGCGFERVITNLPNFPIERADFTLEGGYHGGAAGFVSIFEPLYFEQGNTLYIIDPARGLPAGFNPRSLPLTCVVSVQNAAERTDIVNAIILVYRTNVSPQNIIVRGYIPSIRFVHESPATGGTGDGAFRVEIFKRVVDWKDLSTGLVAYSQETEVNTKVWTRRGGAEKLVSDETVKTDYQGKLKVRHEKTIDAIYPNPNAKDAPDIFGRIWEEETRIEWKPDLSNPGESIITRQETHVSGFVLAEAIAGGKTLFTPILVAARNGIVKGKGRQSGEFRAIQTEIVQLMEVGYNQAEIKTTVIDHLTGSLLATHSQTVTGSRSTYSPAIARGGGGGTTVINRELIKDADSISKHGLRRAGTLDIGDLDPAEGRLIATRRLKRLTNPRRVVSIALPGVDLAIRRGSVVKPPLRAGGFDVPFIVTGYEITGRNLGTPAARIEQTLQATEIGE